MRLLRHVQRLMDDPPSPVLKLCRITQGKWDAVSWDSGGGARSLGGQRRRAAAGACGGAAPPGLRLLSGVTGTAVARLPVGVGKRCTDPAACGAAGNGRGRRCQRALSPACPAAPEAGAVSPSAGSLPPLLPRGACFLKRSASRSRVLVTFKPVFRALAFTGHPGAGLREATPRGNVLACVGVGR